MLSGRRRHSKTMTREWRAGGSGGGGTSAWAAAAKRLKRVLAPTPAVLSNSRWVPTVLAGTVMKMGSVWAAARPAGKRTAQRARVMRVFIWMLRVWSRGATGGRGRWLRDGLRIA